VNTDVPSADRSARQGPLNVCPLKRVKVKIGLAMIDKGRCLPYAHATPCIVCEEVCPTSKKAIWFEEGRVRNRQGNDLLVKQPRVDLELCHRLWDL